MRVAVDIDNVTEDWEGGWVEAYQLWFDREVDPAQLGRWDAMTAATHFGSTAEFWAWFRRAEVWDRLEYVPGAPSGLEFLQTDPGFSFVFCTARPDHGSHASRRLATKWGTFVDFYNDTSKHLSRADIWIDDSPHVLENLADHGKPSIRLERPWNEGAPSTFSAATWPEIIAILKELA
jgi:5'(3')-deoxyribonucleotidase